MNQLPQGALRQLKPDDLEIVVDIDRRITGRSRQAFFEKRLQTALADVHGFIATAVECDGKLTGFAIARLQDGEFGNNDRVATLDVIEVDPDSRHSGLGSQLLQRTAEVMNKLNVHELRTQVGWREAALIRFFAASGFTLAPRHVLERSTASSIWDQAAGDGNGNSVAVEDVQHLDAGVPDYSAPADNYTASSRDEVIVRSLAADDLDAIARIDRKLTGRDRGIFLAAKLREVVAETGIRISQVAECDGIPIGFVMARVDYGEYGRAEPAAVLDVIGVDPGFADQGVGRALLSQLVLNLSTLRVETLRTTVSWNNISLLGFLDAAGFAPSQQLLLSRSAG